MHPVVRRMHGVFLKGMVEDGLVEVVASDTL